MLGILQKVFVPKLGDWVSMSMQTTQGWILLPLMLPMAHRLPWPALLLGLLGGFFYMVGLAFLVTGRPGLWPRVFSHHELFHVFVVAGSAAHYAMTFWYVARFPEV